MHPFINIGVRVAREAGEIIMRAQQHLEEIEISAKSKNNFVTSVDIAAEDLIVSKLRQAYPDHAILAEERGHATEDDQRARHSDYQWIIDPLDGTTNFIHGYPHFCISIALLYQGKIQHGIIYDPVKQDIYTASKGEGARKNNRRICVSKCKKIEEAMIATGLPSSAGYAFNEFGQSLSSLASASRSIRLAGSAALDLAYVASGQLDGYWSAQLCPWDIAAGALLIREAGGMCSDDLGHDDVLKSGNIIASNVKLVRSLADHTQQFYKRIRQHE